MKEAKVLIKKRIYYVFRGKIQYRRMTQEV